MQSTGWTNPCACVGSLSYAGGVLAPTDCKRCRTLTEHQHKHSHTHTNIARAKSIHVIHVNCVCASLGRTRVTRIRPISHPPYAFHPLHDRMLGAGKKNQRFDFPTHGDGTTSPRTRSMDQSERKIIQCNAIVSICVFDAAALTCARN